MRVEEAAAEAFAGKRGRGGGSGDENHAWPPNPEYFYIFIFFKNVFLQKYIFGFIFYSFIPLPPGRGR